MVEEDAGPQLVSALQSILRDRALTPGQAIVVENALSDALYIVSRGEISILMEDGRELGRCGAGAVVGEVAFLDRAPASATAKASTAAHVWELRRADFDELARTNPQTAAEVLRILCTQLSSRIRKASDRLEVLSDQQMEAPEARPTLFAALRALFFGEP